MPIGAIKIIRNTFLPFFGPHPNFTSFKYLFSRLLGSEIRQKESVFISLIQWSQTRGPRAACGPLDAFLRPATSLKLLKLLLKLLFFVV